MIHPQVAQYQKESLGMLAISQSINVKMRREMRLKESSLVKNGSKNKTTLTCIGLSGQFRIKNTLPKAHQGNLPQACQATPLPTCRTTNRSRGKLQPIHPNDDT